MTYYEILGVTDKATDAEIKRAYRKLASQHHPDKGGDKAKFQEIQSAYDTLSNPQKRQQYDMQRNGFGSGFKEFRFHSGDPNIDDIFRNFGFGDPFSGFARPQRRRNRDLRVEIPITLASTLAEQTKTISVATTNGERETVEVKIPRGVTSNTNIKYSELGDNMFNTIPRGDLYVHFAVEGVENYAVNGIDLYTQVSVNCLLAITGTSVNVNGIDGKVFEVSIPAGTQPNTRFRIPQQGLYQLNSNVRGNLYVDVVITVPTELSSEQLDLVRSLINNQ